MNEIEELRQKLSHDVPMQSLDGHQNGSHLSGVLQEIYEAGKQLRLDEKSTPPVAIAAAAAAVCIGWKFGISRFIRKESKSAASENLALGTCANDLSKNSIESKLSKLSCINSKLDGNFRYFEASRGLGSTIYRFPKNGLPLLKQDIADVERLTSGGQWVKYQRETLKHELFKGWFEEKSDEITIQRAQELINRL